jgi:outer membrane protein OmpA-like peptidoglycan-associated protein
MPPQQVAAAGPMPLMPAPEGMNDFPVNAVPPVPAAPAPQPNSVPAGSVSVGGGQWNGQASELTPPVGDMFAPTTQKAVPYTGSGAPKKIYFSYGSSRIGKAGRETVSELAENHAAEPGSVLHVDGHASPSARGISDPVKREIVNLKLSMDRAFNVSRALINKGVPASAIETRAFGDTQPAPAGEHGSAEASSRRVEVTTTP